MGTHEDRKQRALDFGRILSTGKTPDGQREVEFETFRRLCFAGIPDSPQWVRARCWRVLLNYTPWAKRSEWSAILHAQRTLYYGFVRDLTSYSPPPRPPALSTPPAPSTDPTDPLVYPPPPPTAAYLLPTHPDDPDLPTLEQIDKDVRRTLPDMAFFQQPVPAGWAKWNPLLAVGTGAEEVGQAPFTYSHVPTSRALFDRVAHLRHPESGSPTRSNVPHSSSVSSLGKFSSAPTSGAPEDLPPHADSLLRVLFLYAKLNPGVGYVQGMNEVLAPMYFVLAQGGDKDGESERAHAEPDAFFLLTALLSQFQDHFMRSLDNLRTPPTSRGGSRPTSGIASAVGSEVPTRMGSKVDLAKGASRGELDEGKDKGSETATKETPASDARLSSDARPSSDRSRPSADAPRSSSEVPHPLTPQDPPSSIPGPPVPTTRSSADLLRHDPYTNPKHPDHPTRKKHKRRIVGAGGVSHSMGRVWLRLRERDGEVWRDLTKKSIHPIFFLFRWLTVLLTQEFPLPDLLRVWDSLLADVAVDVSGDGPPRVTVAGQVEWEKRERRDVSWRWDWVVEFSVSMVVSARHLILAASFPDSLKLLQNYPLDLIPLDVIAARAFANYDVAVGRGLAGPDRYRAPGEEDDSWDEEGGMEVMSGWVTRAGEFWSGVGKGVVEAAGAVASTASAGSGAGTKEPSQLPVDYKVTEDSMDASSSPPVPALTPAAAWTRQTSTVLAGMWARAGTVAAEVAKEMDAAVGRGDEGVAKEALGEPAKTAPAKDEKATAQPAVPKANTLDSFKRLWGSRTPEVKIATVPSPSASKEALSKLSVTTSSQAPAVTVAAAASSFSSLFRPRGESTGTASPQNPFLPLVTSPRTSLPSVPVVDMSRATTVQTKVDTAKIVEQVGTSLQGVWRRLGGVDVDFAAKPKVVFDANARPSGEVARADAGKLATSTSTPALPVPDKPPVAPTPPAAAPTPSRPSVTTTGAPTEGWDDDLDMDDLDAWLEKVGGDGKDVKGVGGSRSGSPDRNRIEGDVAKEIEALLEGVKDN